MIQIGLTGWGDHPDLYFSSAKDKLKDYSAHFPVVEVDTSFYAIPSIKNSSKWIKETPDNFQFVVKAYQEITGHLRGESHYESMDEMFQRYRESLQPFKEAGKLSMVLVQFPPWFICVKENVEYIRRVKEELNGFELAIEFRHQSWYSSKLQEGTLDFLKSHELHHTVCDEPQVGEGSVPLIPIATSEKVLVRLHGRNTYGWINPGNNENWREVRYLYDYNKEELAYTQNIVEQLQKQAKEVVVLFNNNSGGHAAKNAKAFQKMLGIEFEGLAPKQLDLFEGGI
ncbi:DUF72 domain-containing protein [Psychrobacillus sp. OK032]|uniref:DUF72 domain-containing protein n=1 Tax=Psychrobacillus sp. OK032 TaxID=1884358 RepID=UPI0008B5D592|nr:DUF72 domain-containing protein [Psychrobacillus sp. OK032]SES16728.1 Uncharacterized conserved protein YecE, DUF72 family [Psychrobacillus sp. OK032]